MVGLSEVPWLSAVTMSIWADTHEMEHRARLVELLSIHLNAQEIADVVVFLNALTGETADPSPHFVQLD